MLCFVFVHASKHALSANQIYLYFIPHKIVNKLYTFVRYCVKASKKVNNFFTLL